MELRIDAEIRAQKAQNSSVFQHVNLIGIRSGVAELANHIGAESIFSEYTRHDISHIDAMLRMLNWLIQDHEKDALSDADWLMLVLSIYFHDIGMIVTKEEFDNRAQSDFQTYKDNYLLSDDVAGRDYAHKQAAFGSIESEKFLYQEFVRYIHAARIRDWLTGTDNPKNGFTRQQLAAVREVVGTLPTSFLEDLGLVCESHHLDDLDDVGKYRVRRRYGDTDNEMVNLQYIAVMLRTTDLLHVTKDRTPSIAFRIVNPSNPVSVREWQRHMPVVAVAGMLASDREGNQVPSLPRNTIEVHADFTDAEGFFSLTRYLQFAADQIHQSYNWIATSKRRYGLAHNFEWRYIDQANISARGFLAEQFGFELDQYKILELLTGHTLYNDSNVVLRELTQNAIDAVRLQFADETGRTSDGSGQVEIFWDSKGGILTVQDNGTGMSQTIIEQNFLKVGASRYQEPKFKDRYPDFSPISRFGIGVLSAFMIADAVEVITSNIDDEEARHLSLRDVHGKYLVRLLRKDSEEVPPLIRNHGTQIKLTIRASAELTDIPRILSSWFVLPGCSIAVQVDDEPVVTIGAARLSEILNEALRRAKYGEDLEHGTVKIREDKAAGLTVAYAVKYHPYFKEWEFLRVPRDESSTDGLQLGICVEGVRVVGDTPGFSDLVIFAIANATGHQAPRTNVARTQLDDTPEYRQTVREIHAAYCRHIRSEVEALFQERGFSKSWASAEARLMADVLLTEPGEGGRRRRVRSSDRNSLLLAEVRKLPLFVVDENGDRNILSLDELMTRDKYYSIDSLLARYANNLARELPIDVSLSRLVSAADIPHFVLPEGPIIEVGYGVPALMFRDDWEISGLYADEKTRRLDVEWAKISSDGGRWITFPTDLRNLPSEWLEIYRSMRSEAEPFRFGPPRRKCHLPDFDITTRGLDDFDAVEFSGAIYLLSGKRWRRLHEIALANTGSSYAAHLVTLTFLEAVIGLRQRFHRLVSSDADLSDLVKSNAPAMQAYAQELVALLGEGIRVFSTRQWERSSGPDDEDQLPPF